MEIKIIEETKRKMVFEIKGAGHTLCNIIKEELNNNKKVTIATYVIDHPLTGSPRFAVETDSTITPRQAVNQAVKKLSDAMEKLGAEAAKKLK